MAQRAAYTQRLADLEAEVMVLGQMADLAVRRAMAAFHARDLAAAQGIMHDDNAIDEKRFAIEERTLEIIAREQPLATDLRVLAAILQVVSELERIGDHAEGIAKLTLMSAEAQTFVEPLELEDMTKAALDMLGQSLRALLTRDVALAMATCDADDEVDRLYDRIYQRLLVRMRAQPALVRRATYTLWVAHNLERIADRATNICERVGFLTGQRLSDHKVSVY